MSQREARVWSCEVFIIEILDLQLEKKECCGLRFWDEGVGFWVWSYS